MMPPAMPRKVDQINLTYDAGEDRMLLRVRGADGTESALWLTRRYLQRLWQGLLAALTRDPSVTTQPSPEAREAVVAFRHAEAVRKADFRQPYRGKGRAGASERGPSEAKPRPAGEAPPEGSHGLVTEARIVLADPRRPALVFRTAEGREVSLALDGDALHSFCGLVQRAARATDWDLDLHIPGVAGPGAEPAGEVH